MCVSSIHTHTFKHQITLFLLYNQITYCRFVLSCNQKSSIELFLFLYIAWEVPSRYATYLCVLCWFHKNILKFYISSTGKFVAVVSEYRHQPPSFCLNAVSLTHLPPHVRNNFSTHCAFIFYLYLRSFIVPTFASLFRPTFPRSFLPNPFASLSPPQLRQSTLLRSIPHLSRHIFLASPSTNHQSRRTTLTTVLLSFLAL